MWGGYRMEGNHERIRKWMILGYMMWNSQWISKNMFKKKKKEKINLTKNIFKTQRTNVKLITPRLKVTNLYTGNIKGNMLFASILAAQLSPSHIGIAATSWLITVFSRVGKDGFLPCGFTLILIKVTTWSNKRKTTPSYEASTKWFLYYQSLPLFGLNT